MAGPLVSLVSLGFLLFSTACQTEKSEPTPGPVQAQKERTLSVVAMTDFHGALGRRTLTTKSGEELYSGSAALLAGYVNLIKDHTNGPTIVLDAGDMFQGTLISNTAEGAPVVKFFNYLGVRGAAVGNHEFDFGPVGEEVVPIGPADDPRGAIKQRSKQAKFPLLAANVRFADDSYPDWLLPSDILEIDGLKIGLIGAATVSTPNTTVRKNLEGLEFRPIIPAVKEQAEKLRARGVDFVFLTMHDGSSCFDNAVASVKDISSCDKDEELIKVAQGLPAGLLDGIVGGHTHRGVYKHINGTVVMQAFSRGGAFGWAEFSLEKKGSVKDHGIFSVCGAVVPVGDGSSCLSSIVREFEGKPSPAMFLGKPVKDDPKVVKMLEADFKRVQAIKDEPVGVATETELTRSYFDESSLGNFVADMMAVWGNGDYDVALSNNGGVRANLKAKDLTYGDIFEVLPFDNKPAVIELKGSKLLEIVTLGVQRDRGGHSWSSEMTFSMDNCKVSDVKLSGQAIDPNKTYKILTNDYLAGGGSGFAGLGIEGTATAVDVAKVTLMDAEKPLRDLVVAAIKKEGVAINAASFFDAANPRQKVVSLCNEAGRSSEVELEEAEYQEMLDRHCDYSHGYHDRFDDENRVPSRQ